MAKEAYSKSDLSTADRLTRATEFLVRLNDLLIGRIDRFEDGILKLVTDEYLDVIRELNSGKKGK